MELEPTEKTAVRDPLLDRPGIVRVSLDATRRNPSELLSMFAHMVVLRTDYKWEHNCIEYLGLSSQFGFCPQGARAPVYEAVFKLNEEGVGVFQGFEKPGV